MEKPRLSPLGLVDYNLLDKLRIKLTNAFIRQKRLEKKNPVVLIHNYKFENSTEEQVLDKLSKDKNIMSKNVLLLNRIKEWFNSNKELYSYVSSVVIKEKKNLDVEVSFYYRINEYLDVKWLFRYYRVKGKCTIKYLVTNIPYVNNVGWNKDAIEIGKGILDIIKSQSEA